MNGAPKRSALRDDAYAPAVDACKPTETKDVKDDTREIVVCAQKVEGYRIDPDVLKAQRIMKKNGKPRGPERLVDNSCASVGPMGCRGGAGINLIAAALTAATMVQKAAAGENVGEMFITDPQPDEYQIYLRAKGIADEAIRSYGILRGSVLAAWRLLRCNPFSYGGYDPVSAQTLFRRAPSDSDST